MVQIIKNVVLFAGKLYYNLIYKFKLKRPSIIIIIDGGICSQMHQYLLGVTFSKKNIEVEYDLSFFKYHGMDIEHKQVRNFDLLKAFPYLKFKLAPMFKTKVFEKYFANVGKYPNDLSTDWTNLTPPKILKGYYADPEELYSDLYNETFKIDFEVVLDSDNKIIFDKISEYNESVAIHVRRGDLSTYNPAYGYPVTLQYYSDAISLFCNKLDKPHFFIFSDDTVYVKNELIPSIKTDFNYTVISNGSEKGYMDLALISNCKHQITSKGSLGKYGALLNNNKEKIIIVSKDDNQIFMLNKISTHVIKL